MVKRSVHDDTCRECKGKEIRHRIVDGQVHWGVFVIRRDVERVIIGVHYTSNVVHVPKRSYGELPMIGKCAKCHMFEE